MALLEAKVLALVVSAVIEQVSEQAVDESEKALSAQVRSWLGRHPQKLAIQTALVRTEARFAKAHAAAGGLSRLEEPSDGSVAGAIHRPRLGVRLPEGRSL